MQRNANTHYPILLVHGLFGFDRIGPFELFHDVKQTLRSEGARVFVPYLQATHCNEARGEQLLAQIQRVLEGTGAGKVNLIGHSQGALAARYAAAVAPQSVASVTSVSGPNHGSELADFLRKALEPGCLPEQVAETVATLFAGFLSLLSGHHRLPQVRTLPFHSGGLSGSGYHGLSHGRAPGCGWPSGHGLQPHDHQGRSLGRGICRQPPWGHAPRWGGRGPRAQHRRQDGSGWPRRCFCWCAGGGGGGTKTSR